MANIQKMINKVTKALKAKGRLPLINQEQFIGDNGPCTKYILHDGNPGYKNKDAIAIVYGKANLLKKLIEILKAGDSNG